jgi:hypothetical protein
LRPLDKLVNSLLRRLDRYNSSTDSKQYDRAMEAKFGKLREERAKKTDNMDDKTADVLGNMTQEEIDYYKCKFTPEERYQTMKEIYYFHDSSSYMRFGDNRSDNYRCNADACIPEFEYYPEDGRIEEDDGTVTH